MLYPLQNATVFAKIASFALAFFAGGALASFAQVVAFRVPRGQSFVHGRSFCPVCKHALSAIDMIPLLSWIFLGGKCRYCRAEIPVSHALTEALGGALCVLALLVYGASAYAVAAMALLLCLLALSLFDLATLEIPDAFILTLAAPAAALCALSTFPLHDHLIGTIVLPLPFFLCALAIKDSFGGGDIKLAVVCGLALGWKCALVALFAALVSGGGFAAVQLLTGKMRRGQHFAFGPYLAFGAAFALFFGVRIAQWYSSFFAF